MKNKSDRAYAQVDAVSACHSAVLSAPQAAGAVSALDTYHERFRGRLAPGAVSALRTGSLSFTLCKIWAMARGAAHCMRPQTLQTASIWCALYHGLFQCQAAGSTAMCIGVGQRPHCWLGFALRWFSVLTPALLPARRQQSAYPDARIRGSDAAQLPGKGRPARWPPGRPEWCRQGGRQPRRGACARAHRERLPVRYRPGQCEPVPAAQARTPTRISCTSSWMWHSEGSQRRHQSMVERAWHVTHPGEHQ